MSQNIQQIFVANPASSMVSTDLLYLGRSPYGPTDDFAITFANFVASIGTATPTASTIPRWDAHVNMSANNFLSGFASTATAAATTTLTVSSAYNQYFTGSTTQTVLLPVTSTLVLGFPFRIINNSTGVVTVQSSGANTIQAMAPGSMLLLTCILTSGTTAASWDAQYIIAADVSGAVLLSPSAAQTILTYPLNIPGGIYTPEVFDVNGNIILSFTGVASSVNYLNLVNETTGKNPYFEAVGADTNISFDAVSKGNAPIILETEGTSNQFYIVSGAAFANTAVFNFPNAVGPFVYTLPAATGTIALTGSSASGYVLLAPAAPQTITGFGLTLPNLNTTGNVTAGLGAGGSPGTLISFPTTTSKGRLVVAATDNATGAFDTTISNATAVGQSQVITIPDSGATTANFIISKATATQSLSAVSFSTTTGIVGTTTNDSAAAGSVGEFITSVVTGASPTNINSGDIDDLTSIALSAGDWDVWGNIGFIPAAGTTTTIVQGWISSTSATSPDASLRCLQGYSSSFGYSFTVPGQRFTLSSPTTIYLTGTATFSVSTMTFYGGIYARRRR